MKSSRIALALFALVGVLVAAGCGENESVPADAVAVVDGEPVSRASLDSLLSRAKKSYEGQSRDFPKAGTAEYLSLQTQAVAYLVQLEEYEQEAGELGIQVTDKDVDKRLAEVKKEYFGGSEKRYQSELKKQGLTEAAFRQDVRTQVLSERIVDKLNTDVKVADADVQKYYDDNKQQYVVPESRDVRHILVKTKAQADAIYDQLQGGADFAALAKAKSLDPGSKDSGGKLTIGRGQTEPPFDQTAFLLKVGVLSKPVKTQYGYHVIEPLTEVKEGRTIPLSEVKATIRTQLLEQKKNEAVTTWAEELRKKYEDKISYADGFAPPAEATQSVPFGQSTTG